MKAGLLDEMRDFCIKIKHHSDQMQAEQAAYWRRRWDSDGCDEECGFCGKPEHDIICFWHRGTSVPWPRETTKEGA